jgi:hypothetical protein
MGSLMFLLWLSTNPIPVTFRKIEFIQTAEEDTITQFRYIASLEANTSCVTRHQLQVAWYKSIYEFRLA